VASGSRRVSVHPNRGTATWRNVETRWGGLRKPKLPRLGVGSCVVLNTTCTALGMPPIESARDRPLDGPGQDQPATSSPLLPGRRNSTEPQKKWTYIGSHRRSLPASLPCSHRSLRHAPRPTTSVRSPATIATRYEPEYASGQPRQSYDAHLLAGRQDSFRPWKRVDGTTLRDAIQVASRALFSCGWRPFHFRRTS
jgi:hypothetical protein